MGGVICLKQWHHWTGNHGWKMVRCGRVILRQPPWWWAWIVVERDGAYPRSAGCPGFPIAVFVFENFDSSVVVDRLSMLGGCLC